MIRKLPIFPTMIVSAAISVMIALGFWQLRRADEKNALLARYETAEGLPPIAYPTMPVTDGESPLFRRASVVALLFTGRYLTDTVTAYKLFRRRDLADITFETSGFELDHEITARLLARGLRIVEVPIAYHPRSREEGKKIGARDWFIAIRTFARFSRRSGR